MCAFFILDILQAGAVKRLSTNCCFYFIVAATAIAAFKIFFFITIYSLYFIFKLLLYLFRLLAKTYSCHHCFLSNLFETET